MRMCAASQGYFAPQPLRLTLTAECMFPSDSGLLCLWVRAACVILANMALPSVPISIPRGTVSLSLSYQSHYPKGYCN